MPNLRVKGVAGDGKLKHVSHTSLRQFHVSGGSYAQVHYHPDTRPSLLLRQRLLPAAPGLPGQRQSHGHDPLDGPLRCRGADLLDLRDLPPPDRRPQRGGLRQGPLRPALLPRSTQTQGQRRLRRPPAQGPAPPPQATTPRRHRSDLDPLLWPAPAWPPRDLPLQGQGRYPLVLRLRHRLRDSPRPAVHLGRDRGDPLRDAQRRAPRTAGSGQQSRAPTRMAVPEPVSHCFHVTYAETRTNNLRVSLDAVS